MNIILDMDQTLIHSNLNSYSIYANPIPRPHLKEFLEFVFENCKNVSIWTHGLKEWYDVVYEKVFKHLIPEGKSFHFVRTRQTPIGDYNDFIQINKKLNDINSNIPSISYLKPLLVIYKIYPDEYNENNTFIIDDNPITYSINKKNAIEIIPYNGIDNSDTELLRIMKLIKDNYFI
jgi:TFIIF-interacting CTD phosphatase-like protein